MRHGRDGEGQVGERVVAGERRRQRGPIEDRYRNGHFSLLGKHRCLLRRAGECADRAPLADHSRDYVAGTRRPERTPRGCGSSSRIRRRLTVCGVRYGGTGPIGRRPVLISTAALIGPLMLYGVWDRFVGSWFTCLAGKVSGRRLVVRMLPDFVPAVVGLLAAQGEDAGSARHRLVHAREFDPLSDGVASGFDGAGAGEHARGAEVLVAHPMGVGLEVAEGLVPLLALCRSSAYDRYGAEMAHAVRRGGAGRASGSCPSGAAEGRAGAN